MWCDRCQCDVRVENTASGAVFRCPQCSELLTETPRRNDAIQQARAILERWQSSDLLDRINSTEDIPPLVWSTETSRAARRQSGGSDNQPRKQETPQKWVPPRVHSASAPQPSALPPSVLPPSVPQPAVFPQAFAAGSLNRDNSELNRSTLEAEPPAPAVSLAEQPVVLEAVPASQPERSQPETSLLEHREDEVSNRSQPDEQVFPERLLAESAAEPSVNADVSDPEIPFKETFISPLNIYRAAMESPAEFAEASLDAVSSEAAGYAKSTPVVADWRETQNAPDPEPSLPTKTMKQRTVRRPPMQRRMNPSVSNSGSSSGPIPVSRKLRVDQPGGEKGDAADNSASGSTAASGEIISSVSPETKIVSNSGSTRSGRRFRIDGPEAVDQLAETGNSRLRTQGKPVRRYIDEPHGSQPRGPHFQVNAPRRSNLTALTGQFLAYLGVLGLTIGTAIVIYGHFGGYADYTPTGWLVTTVAQMLLFLGVINLVSGGIEQNNEDVSRRINTLGEQLVRIEQVTEEVLRGPRLSPRLYAGEEDAEVHESARQGVTTE